MRVDLSPLLRGGRGEAIAVAGVRVGEAAAGIDRRALTGAEDDGDGEFMRYADGAATWDWPDGPRTYADGTVFRIRPDGTRVEIPLAERVEAVLQRGGWLRCGEIALRVTDGRIERIFVRGPSLTSLKIIDEDDIARRFGPASGHEQNLGWRHHHYSDRGLVIAWHSGDGRLEHVALGPAPWREPRLGARDLLSELLRAFEELSRVSWAEPREGSVRVRHQRIAALARALELGAVPDLVAGKFLDVDLTEGREEVLADIAARGPLQEAPRPSHASWLFRILLHYRGKVERVVRATSGWLECSDPALLGMIATQDQLGAQLTAMMVDVDRWLCTLMDPAQRTFALQELIAHHGWPDVDLDQIEMNEL
jgi:hypothetical protein